MIFLSRLIRWRQPAERERIVYSRSAKAAQDYLAARRATHARLINETIQDDDARIEMQRAVFGRDMLDAVQRELGV